MRYRLTFITGVAVGYVLGARAGRERYEQLRKSAQRVAQNPAVRNTVEAAALTGRKAATRAFDKVGDRMPGPVADRVRSRREERAMEDDDWGTSNT
ncbi:YtxH domain-containing protein [Streptomyces sp. XD-27]|uniref:YtxH domain-containing protein n=1 Tax=Streptomyces sp. XD-27 TaxID=3062779 RepID=UPI0026F42699|nr:YtxH domain-containing protein [Streptomyces sp. XD-27]WKX70183.1 YtxH domain-containing protein [Streptomyces sp. XD-27]